MKKIIAMIVMLAIYAGAQKIEFGTGEGTIVGDIFEITGDATIASNLTVNGAVLATNYDLPLTLGSTNAQGNVTIDLAAGGVQEFFQTGGVTNIVLSYDTNKVSYAEVLFYANGDAINWPTNGVTWQPDIPEGVTNQWQSIIFRAHRGNVQAAYIETYD